MPVLDIIIPEVTKQCIEVISEQTANRLLEYLNIKNLFVNNDNLFFKSDDLRASNFDDSNNNIRVHNNRCDVEIIPSYNSLETKFDILNSKVTDTHIQSNHWTYMDYPLFSDNRSLVNLFEISLPSGIELRFNIKVKSIELADAIHTSLFSRYLVGGSVVDSNLIQFSYGIPDNIVLLLYRIYKMQDDIVAAMSFKDYVTIGSNTGITAVINRDRLNNNIEFVMQRFNSNVLGMAEYNGDKHITEDFNKVSNRYVIEFSYFLQWSKPNMLRIIYPIMVYNKIVDDQYIGKQQVNMAIGEGNQYLTDIGMNKSAISVNKNNYNINTMYPLVKTHYYDDWHEYPSMYKELLLQYQSMFIAVLQLVKDDDGNLSLTVDLENEVFPLLNEKFVNELKVVINDEILDENYYDTSKHIFRRLHIFNIAVFANDNVIDFKNLSITNNILTVSGNLNITKTYRLVISQVKDLTRISRSFIFYMLDHPDYYKELLNINMHYLISTGYIKVIRNLLDNTKTHHIIKRKIQNQDYAESIHNSTIINNYVVKIIRN